jgi:lysophospholipase L1-like esterase
MTLMRLNVLTMCLLITAAMTPFASAQTQPSTRPAGPALVQGGPGLPLPANPALPTLWLIGDSTVNNNANGGLGWGAPFIKLFDASKINVVNRARGGRSSRSFQAEGLWDAALEVMKRGDFMILQMGHNDGGDIRAANRRGSIRGLGEETEEVAKPDGTMEVVHTYGWYMRKYASDAKAKGVSVIICSPVPHLPRAEVKQGDVEKSSYVEWSEAVAKSQDVPFINLNKIIMGHYTGLQPQEIREKYFTPPGDGTHTNPAGAGLNAQSVLEGIKQLPESPLTKFVAAN